MIKVNYKIFQFNNKSIKLEFDENKTHTFVK